nr:MAG TPA: hypothetical protein [Caudoviricetes sp.]
MCRFWFTIVWFAILGRFTTILSPCSGMLLRALVRLARVFLLTYIFFLGLIGRQKSMGLLRGRVYRLRGQSNYFFIT